MGIDIYNKLNGDWMITEDSFSYMKEIILNDKIKSIIEFGSGASTLRFTQEFPQLDIISLEHDYSYYNNLSNKLIKLNLHKKVKLIHSPLRFQIHFGKLFLSYNWHCENKKFDLVIIDGPPHYTRRGREACFYIVMHQLRIGSVVILDDYGRYNEQSIVRNWLSSFPNQLSFYYIDIGNKLAILKLEVNNLEYKFTIRTYLDNLLSNLYLLKNWIKKLFKLTSV